MTSSNPLRLALLGYGKMGRAVETAALERGHSIAAIIDPAQGEAYSDELARSGAQVAIDFTTGSAVIDNVREMASAGLDLVVGTTGWDDRVAEAHRIVKGSEIGMIHSPNFAIGVHIFRKVVELAASLVDQVGLYDVGVSESHHQQKLDTPSGTAIHIAEAILVRMRAKDDWEKGPPHGASDPGRLYVSSTRSGEIPGTHVVSFEGPLDRIYLKHEALDRSVFAQGAVIAAEWVHGRRGMFTIDDFFSGEG